MSAAAAAVELVLKHPASQRVTLLLESAVHTPTRTKHICLDLPRGGIDFRSGRNRLSVGEVGEELISGEFRPACEYMPRTPMSPSTIATPVLHPELVPGGDVFDLIKCKLSRRRRLLSYLLSLLTAALLIGFTLYYFDVCHSGLEGDWLSFLLMCGMIFFTYNGVLAALYPAEIAQRSSAIVVPQALHAACVVIAVTLDFAYHSQLSAEDMRSTHFMLHEACALGCIIVQAVNCYLLANSQLTWSAFRGLQLLDGAVTFIAQVTANGEHNIGVPCALARSVPPMVAAALISRENRHWVAARWERSLLYHVRVDLNELPAAALDLSQHAARGEYHPMQEDDVDSITQSDDDRQGGTPSLVPSHYTAKLHGDDVKMTAAGYRALLPSGVRTPEVMH